MAGRLAEFETEGVAISSDCFVRVSKVSMQFKSVVLAAALLMAGAAQAAPVVLDLSSGAASFSSALATQEYQFTLPTDVVGYGSVTASFGTKLGYSISSIVFNGTTLVPEPSTPKFFNFTLFDGPLSAGTYSFTVNGVSKGGGQFHGQLEVTAVPEPESLALALGGLGVMGLLARRRRAA